MRREVDAVPIGTLSYRRHLESRCSLTDKESDSGGVYLLNSRRSVD